MEEKKQSQTYKNIKKTQLKRRKQPEWVGSVTCVKASGCNEVNSRELQSKRMRASIMEIFFLVSFLKILLRPPLPFPNLIACQLGREIHHIPKDGGSRIRGHHQRNLIAYRCPKTSDCIIHRPGVEELEGEALMSPKAPHSAHAWESDSETLLSNTKRLGNLPLHPHTKKRKKKPWLCEEIQVLSFDIC